MFSILLGLVFFIRSGDGLVGWLVGWSVGWLAASPASPASPASLGPGFAYWL